LGIIINYSMNVVINDSINHLNSRHYNTDANIRT